ncbi:hypothetical protein J4208_05050 [Candidatus Woesearchaeota archaeon]|nr:hypothetical protein [Candidatus Woesearchaeota archaeon]
MVHIGFDIDGVLADFAGIFVPWYNERYGTAFVESDFWTHEFYRIFGVTREQLNADIRLFVQTPLVEQIQPYQEMPAIVQRLAQTYGQHSQVTARFTAEAQQRSRAFSDRHYPNCFSNIHISHHPEENPRGYKGAVCKQNGISVLVEDQVDYAEEALTHGIQVILINRPWNIGHALHPSVPRITVQDLETTLAHMFNGVH